MNKTNKQPNYSTDQTDFSAQEPLYEDVSIPQEPIKAADSEQSPPTFFQSKVFKIGSIILAIIAVFILVLITLLLNSGSPQQVEQPSPTPTAQPTSLDPLQQRINDLSQVVIEADPAVDNLPLPPVDLTISLEE